MRDFLSFRPSSSSDFGNEGNASDGVDVLSDKKPARHLSDSVDVLSDKKPAARRGSSVAGVLKNLV
jgi:hypothetical protein